MSRGPTVRGLIARVAAVAGLLALRLPACRALKEFLWADAVPWIWMAWAPALAYLISGPRRRLGPLSWAIGADLLLLALWSMSQVNPGFGIGETSTYGDVPQEVAVDYLRGQIGAWAAWERLAHRTDLAPVLVLLCGLPLLLGRRLGIVPRKLGAVVLVALIGGGIYEWCVRVYPWIGSSIGEVPLSTILVYLDRCPYPRSGPLNLVAKGMATALAVALMIFVVRPAFRRTDHAGGPGRV